MPKIFITGSGGTGKSTIIKRLSERGYTAYDTDDMPETTRLENLAGEPVEWPDGFVDWSKYRWNWQRPAIEKLLASDDTVFLGAIVGNQKDFADLFDTIIALTADPATHEHRRRTRSVHTHGQDDRNIRHSIEVQAEKLKRFMAYGAIPVVNNRPLDEVVDEILAIAHVS